MCLLLDSSYPGLGGGMQITYLIQAKRYSRQSVRARASVRVYVRSCCVRNRNIALIMRAIFGRDCVINFRSLSRVVRDLLLRPPRRSAAIRVGVKLTAVAAVTAPPRRRFPTRATPESLPRTPFQRHPREATRHIHTGVAPYPPVLRPHGSSSRWYY